MAIDVRHGFEVVTESLHCKRFWLFFAAM